MKLETFLDGYDKAKDKEAYFKKHVVNQYVSFAKKIEQCKKIVDTNWIEAESGTLVFRANSSARYFVFVLELFKNYTDITIDDTDPINYYDEMCKRGLILSLASEIGSEYNEFNTLLSMEMDDLIENERSFAGYLDGKINTISTLFKSVQLEPDKLTVQG